MGKLALLFVVSMVFSVGCSSPTAEAERRVSSVLRDPDSAKFRNVKKFTTGAICGEVNGKNALGGYVGFTPFLIDRRGSLAIHPGIQIPIGDAEKAKYELEIKRFDTGFEVECKDL